MPPLWVTGYRVISQPRNSQRATQSGGMAAALQHTIPRPMPPSLFRAELRRLFSLALPLAAAQAGTQMMNIVDIAMLGHVGARELGGAGLAGTIFFAIAMLGTGTIYGMDPMIAQALGANNHERARQLLWQGVWLALIVTGVLTVPLLFAPRLLPLLHVKPDLIEPATAFLLVRTTGLAPLLLFFVLRSYLQAQHITRPMIVSMLVCNIVNFLGDLLFVFGGAQLPAWTGPLRNIPPLGAAGAAIVTVMASFVQLAIVAAAVRRIRVKASPRFNGADVLQAVRIGLPIGTQICAEIGIFALVGLLAGSLGTYDLAAHQLVLGLASFTYSFALGFAAAGAARVGLAVGARDQHRTRAAGFAAIGGGALVMAIGAIAFAAFPRAIARMFTNQSDVIATAIPLFLVAAVFQLSDGIQTVASGALRGAGDTRFSFLSNLFGHWLLGLPIALFLGFSRGMGIVGLWWGLCVGLTAVAILLFARFHRLSSNAIVPIGETRLA